jgi:hypothetical protein
LQRGMNLTDGGDRERGHRGVLVLVLVLEGDETATNMESRISKLESRKTSELHSARGHLLRASRFELLASRFEIQGWSA